MTAFTYKEILPLCLKKVTVPNKFLTLRKEYSINILLHIKGTR